ncbi:MAG: putative addiction module antidote protein [Acinetobacter sp.]|mgnify:CR=1 FL=1|jgi:probable addiction module antidote protein|nr:MAG: putative addiction module antidote protein [Acinetobacter sp.]
MVKISELKRFDMAEYLEDEQAITEYLTIVLGENDPVAFIAALNTVARARGMSQIAKDAGVNRESLYRYLNGSASPHFDTISRVLNALGVQLAIVPKTG